MPPLIKSIEAISTDWIRAILEPEHEDFGRTIESVAIAKRWKTISSEVAVVALETGGGGSDLPKSLFVKITHPQIGEALEGLIRGKEVEFYNRHSKELPKGALLTCHFAEYSEPHRTFNLVFEDLSATHGSTEWPLSPHIHHCEMAMDCLAGVHAHWWDHPDLETIGKPVSQAESVREFEAFFQANFDEFVKFMGDRLPRNYRVALALHAERFEHLSARLFERGNRTLTHGDSHFWNFLFPNDPSGQAKLFDWQSYGVGLGTGDLAYMLAMHWYPSRRREFEIPLLEHYHAKLVANGVRDYDFQDLLRDYRWSILDKLIVPLWQWKVNLSPAIWAGHLERILLAFEDLDCMELLRN